MTKIYRESFGFFLTSLPALLVFSVVIETSFWFFESLGLAGASIVALTLVAYYFHRHFLFGEILTFKKQPIAAGGAPPLKFGWFILISTALLLGPLGVTVVIAFQFTGWQNPWVLLIVFFALYLLALSLFGTALPATVAHDGTYRLSQGVRATFQTMWWLVLGPGLVGTVLVAANLASSHVVEAFGVSERSPILLAYHVLFGTLSFLSTILAVAVLCEMYRKTRPEPRLPQGPGAMDQRPA